MPAQGHVPGAVRDGPRSITGSPPGRVSDCWRMRLGRPAMSRWDVLFAGLAEHLAMRDGNDAPGWSASRGLWRFWFPFDTPGARAGARACSGRVPQAGVFVANYEIDAA